jgi:hypothetical protein
MTDRFSAATADAPATIRDLPLLIDVQCQPTASTSIGATCALSTSADAITPSLVREGKRTIWEIGQVRLFDGGEDGITATQADNSLFMKQGIFVR